MVLIFCFSKILCFEVTVLKLSQLYSAVSRGQASVRTVSAQKTHLPCFIVHVWVCLMILSPSVQIPACLKHALRVYAYNFPAHTEWLWEHWSQSTMTAREPEHVKPVHKWN